jgi:hypothetical protein
MNAPVISPDVTAVAVVEIEPDLAGDWPALLTLAHVRMAALIRESCELRERLKWKPPLTDWPEYAEWAAAARDYHADRRRRERR